MCADWFWSGGHAHPIRSSPGYDEALVGLSKADKVYLRGDTNSYTVSSSREERDAHIEEHKKAKEERLASKKLKPTYRLSAEAQEQRFKPRPKRTLY